MNTPEWTGPAADCLKEKGLDEAATYLEAAPAKADLLERALATMERFIRDAPMQARVFIDPMLALIAEHRGETPDETIARLRPSDPRGPSLLRDAYVPWTIGRESMSAMLGRGYFTADPADDPPRPDPMPGFPLGHGYTWANIAIDRWLADHHGFSVESQLSINPTSLSLRLRSPDRGRSIRRVIDAIELAAPGAPQEELLLRTLDAMRAEVARQATISRSP